jgi:hypothetical protein
MHANFCKVCKNCTKSKRECAGYAPPLVYKQHHNLGHGELSQLDGDQFSFQEQNVTQSLNLRWNEPQHADAQYAFLPAGASYPDMTFGASYHAMPMQPHGIPQPANSQGMDDYYAWPIGQPLSMPHAVDGFPSVVTQSSNFAIPGDAPEHTSIPLDFDPQAAVSQPWPNAHMRQDRMQHSSMTLPTHSQPYQFEQPYSMGQFQHQANAFSLQHSIPPALGQGMWAHATASIGTFVC